MKIVTCASYYWSGSSALIDLLGEYENVKYIPEFEFRFLHDIDGVSDLEYHLVECHNRHNAGHALKRFIKLSKFNSGTFFNERYEKYFNGEYYKKTINYVNSLTDLKYQGWWFYDIYDKGRLYYYFIQSINHLLYKINHNYSLNLNEITYCSHPTKSKFLFETKKYVSSLMKTINDENKEILAIEQLVPSQNTSRVMKYFDDELFVIIMQRDPRDVYVSSRFSNERVVPKDVNEFCDWYIYAMESGNSKYKDTDHILRIHFEDLIYKYDKTVKMIEKFIGINNSLHHQQYTKFIPKVSINNTQMWKKEKINIDEDIKIIEDKCKDYLYNFANK